MRGQRTRIPDLDGPIPVRILKHPRIRSRHKLGSVRGKRAQLERDRQRVGLLAQQLQFACQTSQQASVLAKEARFEGKGAPQSQTLIVLLYGYLLLDPETSLVPSGEKATELIDEPLWALVFSVTHLMSVAIILRTREKKRCLGCMRAFGSMEVWDHSTARLQARKAQTCNSQQRAARVRGIACGVWLRSSS